MHYMTFPEPNLITKSVCDKTAFELFLNNLKLVMLYNIVQTCIAIFSLYSMKYAIVMDISKQVSKKVSLSYWNI